MEEGPLGRTTLETVDQDPGKLTKDDERRWDNAPQQGPCVRTSMKPTEMGA